MNLRVFSGFAFTYFHKSNGQSPAARATVAKSWRSRGIGPRMTALAARRLWRRLDEFFIQFPFSKITCKLSNNFVCRRKKSTLKKIILREGEVGCHVGWLWLGGVRCPSAFVERGSLDRVLTSAQHVLHSVRVLHASHSPLPPPSLLTTGFVSILVRQRDLGL